MKNTCVNNNLFKFATGELSQDAMICWLCNNYNIDVFDEKTAKLKELGRRIIQYFLEDECLEIEGKIDIIRQVYAHDSKTNHKGKMDILIIVNRKYAIIVEDKTYTSEHDGQLDFYRTALEDGNYEIKKELTNFNEEIPRIGFNKEDIRVVYLKTGFHYPEDCEVEADLKITNVKWLNLLKDYENNSEILDNYIEKLQEDLNWYKEIDTKFKMNMTDEVLSTSYGQYLLISNSMDNITSKSFSHGSSAGMPWTDNIIAVVPYDVDNRNPNLKGRKFVIICKIVKRSNKLKGRRVYCASFRQYDREISKEKKDNGELADIDVKIRMFNDLREKFEKTLQNTGDLNKWYKKGENRGGCFESEIGYFALGNDDDQIRISEFPALFQELLIHLREQNLVN